MAHQFLRHSWVNNKNSRKIRGGWVVAASGADPTIVYGDGFTVTDAALETGQLLVTLDKSYALQTPPIVQLCKRFSDTGAAFYVYDSWAGGDRGVFLGSNTGATKDTDPDNALRIKTSSGAAFSDVTVTVSNTLAVATLVADLNTGFATAGLALRATTPGGTNKVKIQATEPGITIYLDSVANGSTLNTACGFSTTAASYGPTGAPASFVVQMQSADGTENDLAADVAEIVFEVEVKGRG